MILLKLTFRAKIPVRENDLPVYRYEKYTYPYVEVTELRTEPSDAEMAALVQPKMAAQEVMLASLKQRVREAAVGDDAAAYGAPVRDGVLRFDYADIKDFHSDRALGTAVPISVLV